ncbi:MAG: signal peptidase I [Firmicutes bacterium]|nr:signal peptidase I [Bacillota bacterium]
MAKLCNIIGTILIVAVIVVCLAVTVPRLFGLSSYVVVSGSMTPAIPVNSLIYVKSCEPATLQEGDVILFYDSKDGTPITHRVVENDTDTQKIITKGDANNGIDMRPALYTNVEGRVVAHVPVIGAITGALGTVMGKIAAAMIILAGYLLAEVGRRVGRKNRGQEK